MLPPPKTLIRCYVDEVTRTDFLNIYSKLGHTYIEKSSVVEPDPLGVLMATKTFDSEEAFVKEHDRLVEISRAISPAASLETFYHQAGQETPIYSRRS